jgi:UDP-glucuronate 4-epimerase
MKYLVTGSCGFIGSTLSQKLLDIGHQVLGVDIFTDNYLPALKVVNQRRLLENANYTHLEVDLIDSELEPLMQEISGIFHLAGHPSVHGSWGSDFSVYVNRNVIVTEKLLKAALKSRVPKFVNSSSSSVYGRASTTPTFESNSRNPVSPYGVTKLAAEELCTLYGSELGLNSVSLRYFTVFGPRQRPDMAFNKIVAAGLQSSPFHLHGDGSQVRDFTYVDDVAEANIAAMNAQTDPGDVFNIGGGSPISMLDAISMLEKIMDLKIDIQSGAMGPGNPMITQADCSSAHKVLAWKPKVGIFEGLQKQVDWQMGRS